MNAQEALELTKQKLPLVEGKEYDSIIKDIKRLVDDGKTEMHILSAFGMPSDKVQERLRHDGYHFHVYKAFPFPDMYSICWEKHKKRESNWLERLFFKTDKMAIQ